jgi:hypothetical protein
MRKYYSNKKDNIMSSSNNKLKQKSVLNKTGPINQILYGWLLKKYPVNSFYPDRLKTKHSNLLRFINLKTLLLLMVGCLVLGEDIILSAEH